MNRKRQSNAAMPRPRRTVNEDEENSEEGRDIKEDEVDDEEEERTQVGRLIFFGCHTDQTSHSVL